MSAMFVALAALFWGLSAAIGGVLIASGWQPSVIAFYRGAVGLLLVGSWSLLRPGRSGFGNRRLWFWSALAGVGIAGNFGFYYLSISRGSVAVASTLMYCAPVFVYLVSFALKLERPTPFKWGAIAAVMPGLVMLTRVYEVGGEGVELFGVIAALLSGLSYGLFIFGLKYASYHGTPPGILAIAFTVLVSLLIIPSRGSEILAVPGSQSRLLFLILGILGGGVSFILYVLGLRSTPPGVASILAMVEPVTASFAAVVLLDEGLIAVQLLGMVLILTSVTGLSLSSNREGR
ncbi:MAG: DMT family transporter [Spirochaetaceae bacterium]